MLIVSSSGIKALNVKRTDLVWWNRIVTKSLNEIEGVSNTKFRKPFRDWIQNRNQKLSYTGQNLSCLK